MAKKRRLLDEYRFPGFCPRAGIKGIFGEPRAHVITLKRSQKKLYAVVVARHNGVTTTRRCDVFGTYHAERCRYIWRPGSGVYCAGDVGR